MRRTLWIAIAVSGLLGLAPVAPALAQGRVPIEQVRQMAFDKGIYLISEIELHHDTWKVEGTDKQGNEIKMRIDAVTGEITKIKRD